MSESDLVTANLFLKHWVAYQLPLHLLAQEVGVEFVLAPRAAIDR